MSVVSIDYTRNPLAEGLESHLFDHHPLHRCRSFERASALRSSTRLLQYTFPMPKMKTHSGAKKRFKKTAKGKLLARHSFTSHNLGKKSAKRKRHLGRPVVVSQADHKRVTELLHK